MNKDVFSAKEFARFARTTRHTLVHYEEMDLLLPVSRDKNNYRQYSHLQLAPVNLIRTCQALGMSLSEIKKLKQNRTPTSMVELFESKIKSIDETIDDWCRSRKLLDILKSTILSASDVDENVITVQYYPEQAITLGELNDYSDGKDPYDAIYSFYQSSISKYPDMDVNFSVWGSFSEERIKRHDWHYPDRYYFNNPDGKDSKAAALYAVGYKRGGYGQCGDLYERILEYTAANEFDVCGAAYEEYPLNEICIGDENNYLIRVMITVEKTVK